METYDFSRKTHYTVTVLIIKKDKILFLKQDKSPFWLLPGGHIEDNELPHETAIREAKEETGYDVELIKKLDIWQDDAEHPTKHAFEAKIIGGELNFPKDELLDARWFTKEEIYLMKDKLRTSWIIGAIEILADF